MISSFNVNDLFSDGLSAPPGLFTKAITAAGKNDFPQLLVLAKEVKGDCEQNNFIQLYIEKHPDLSEETKKTLTVVVDKKDFINAINFSNKSQRELMKNILDLYLEFGRRDDSDWVCSKITQSLEESESNLEEKLSIVQHYFYSLCKRKEVAGLFISVKSLTDRKDFDDFLFDLVDLFFEKHQDDSKEAIELLKIFRDNTFFSEDVKKYLNITMMEFLDSKPQEEFSEVEPLIQELANGTGEDEKGQFFCYRYFRRAIETGDESFFLKKILKSPKYCVDYAIKECLKTEGNRKIIPDFFVQVSELTFPPEGEKHFNTWMSSWMENRVNDKALDNKALDNEASDDESGIGTPVPAEI